MPKYTEKVCIDSCIVIAFLKGENEANNKMARIDYCMERIIRSEIKAISAGVIYPELSETHLNKCGSSIEHVEKVLFNRRNYEVMSTSPKIYKLASSIRDYYIKNGIKLKAADSIHLATAIYHEVDAFYTWDYGNKDGVNLLSFNGNVAGYNLKVCIPPLPVQTNLKLL